MKFFSQRVTPLSRARVRVAAARHGWLVDDGSVLRAGFGPVVEQIHLAEGVDGTTDILDVLRRHELIGEGPRGTGLVAFASLPFDRGARATIDLPTSIITILEDGTTWLTLADGGSDPRSIIEIEPEPDQEPLAVRSITYAPTPEEYAHNVAIAVDALRRKELDKVVLARSVAGVLGATIDPGALAVRLRRREPICTLYSLPTGDGRRFVGITPELLVRRDGRSAMSHPLAGTIGLPANENPEDYQTWLLNSAKNQHEHAVLGNEVVAQFERFYDRVWADAEPSIVALRTVAHLGTWVHADTEHEVDAPDAVELVRVLHPTAAVGGIPRDVAYALIQTLEQKDRGHYAGPVGWIDSRGDGDWWVGIRGVLVEGDTFEAWAGAGIVSESDPTAEREETKIKLESVLSSLVADRF